jgi:hypothetical protein
MKLIYSLIVALLFAYSNCQKLVPMKVTSQKININYKYWYDLLGQLIQCPNEGVMKNFVLRKSGNQYYFELQCYSSDKGEREVDYGEPIVKDATYHHTLDTTLYSGYLNDLSTLNTFEMDCTPEYGLNGFKLYTEYDYANRLKYKKINYCKPTKSSFVSKKNLKTAEKRLNTNSLDCFVDILVGRTEAENDDTIGYPLRSVQFKVEGTSTNRKCYYIYSYHKLKNMGKFRDQRHKQFADLRNKNTQVD